MSEAETVRELAKETLMSLPLSGGSVLRARPHLRRAGMFSVGTGAAAGPQCRIYQPTAGGGESRFACGPFLSDDGGVFQRSGSGALAGE